MVLGETVLGGVGCTGWNLNGSKPYKGGRKQVSLSHGGERGSGMNRPRSSPVYKGFLKNPSLYQQLWKPDQAIPPAHSGFQAWENKPPTPLGRPPCTVGSGPTTS